MNSERNRIRLSNAALKIGSGATPRGGKDAYHESGEYSLVRSQNVLDFTFSKDGLAFINEEQASKLNNVALKERDILLNITGDSVARVCQIPKEILPARVNQHVAIIRPNPKILNPEFLKYYLLNPIFKEFMLMLSSAGATRNAITKSMIEDFEIEAPDLPTQKAIAEILSSLDDKIELNNQINQNLEALAQTLFKQWFVDFEFPNENGEPYKSSGGEMVDSELGKIPKGWEVTNLGAVFEFISGFPFKSDDFKEEGIHRIVTIRNVQDGAFLQKTENGIDTIPSKMGDQIKLKEGDVILSLTGNVGRTCFVTGENYLMNQRVLKVKPIRNKELTSLPYFFFRRPEIQQHLISISKGTAQLNLSPVEMKNIKIPFQKEFPNHLFQKLQTLFDMEIETTKESQQLSELRDTLLPKLISGELEVNESLLEQTF